MNERTRFSSKVDIWALGCVMYELCTGKRAFENDFAVYMSAQNPCLYLAVYMDRVDENTNAEVQFIIQQMLESNPTNRPTADDLVTRFQNFLRHGTTPLDITRKSPFCVLD